jgi:hypothetical protein
LNDGHLRLINAIGQQLTATINQIRAMSDMLEIATKKMG